MAIKSGDAGRIMTQGDDGVPYYGPVVPAHSQLHLLEEKTSHP